MATPYKLFFNDLNRVHTGVCQHVDELPADSLCFVQSDMWADGAFIIGRKADIPWAALRAYESETLRPCQWAEIREGGLN